MAAPMRHSARMYGAIPLSFFQSARASSTACGYIKIRWSQQSLHGTHPAISEKNRLPAVAVAATMNMRRSPLRAHHKSIVPRSSGVAIHAPSPKRALPQIPDHFSYTEESFLSRMRARSFLSRPHRLTVRTAGFQSVNGSSILRGATKKNIKYRVSSDHPPRRPRPHRHPDPLAHPFCDDDDEPDPLCALRAKPHEGGGVYDRQGEFKGK